MFSFFSVPLFAFQICLCLARSFFSLLDVFHSYVCQLVFFYKKKVTDTPLLYFQFIYIPSHLRISRHFFEYLSNQTQPFSLSSPSSSPSSPSSITLFINIIACATYSHRHKDTMNLYYQDLISYVYLIRLIYQISYFVFVFYHKESSMY